MAKVRGNSRHIARTQRLNPRIFHRVKGCARNDFGRAQCGVAGGVMMLQPQRKAVGKATRLGDLIGRKQTARHGYLEILARLAWRIGGEGQFYLRLMRERTGSAGQHLLKLFQRGFVGH